MKIPLKGDLADKIVQPLGVERLWLYECIKDGLVKGIWPLLHFKYRVREIGEAKHTERAPQQLWPGPRFCNVLPLSSRYY